MKPAAIVGWTGNGSLEDLARTTRRKLPTPAVRLDRGTRSVLVRGADPIVVARRLSHFPGVSWIAVGYEFDGLDDCLARLAFLGHRYLESGASFKVGVEVDQSEKAEGDVLMEATSTLLKSSRGSHVDDKNPSVKFRVIMVRGRGACGVQLIEGVGGVPTSRKMKAACLVSGGYHSAVTAWMAVLSGFSLTLIHSRDDDESLRQVARLYAELSRRMDASSLGLEVLQGDGPAGDRLVAWLKGSTGEVFTGVHPECRGTASLESLREYRSALFPLLLLQEGEVRSRLDDLGIRGKRGDAVAKLKPSKGRSSFVVQTFGGMEADQNAVLDSIMAQT